MLPYFCIQWKRLNVEEKRGCFGIKSYCEAVLSDSSRLVISLELFGLFCKQNLRLGRILGVFYANTRATISLSYF